MECPSCQYSGTSFGLGQHFRKTDGHRPSYSGEQLEIVEGVLMSDGCLDNRDGNPSLMLEMSNKDYLEYLSDTFGTLVGDITETKSGYYKLSSRRHPELRKFKDFYEGGTKVWPEVNLTPTILKHLYCCDGYKNGSSIIISCKNEKDNKKKVEKIFTKAGFEPMSWYESETSTNLAFSVNESERLWKWMGEPLPGFNYKWPDS